MAQRYYAVDEVAELLGLHVRTVRGYVRDGRLKAARIGKQYRISRADLEEFTGSPVAEPAAEAVSRHTEASTIALLEGVDARAAQRITTLLTATVSGREPAGTPLRVHTVHDAARATLKIVVLGGLRDTAALLDLVQTFAEEA
ncbi:helix-turn-helix domain-containing protein [Actinocorallia aurea]